MSNDNVFAPPRRGGSSTEVQQSRQVKRMRADPWVRTIISKAVKPHAYSGVGRHLGGDIGTPNHNLITRVTQNSAQNVSDAANLEQLIPDIKKGKQIWISSIISPNDLISSTVSFASEGTQVPAEIATAFTEYLTKFWVKDYKLEVKLPEWLDNIMFKRGVNPLLVLPESSIDDLINNDKHSVVTTEDLKAVKVLTTEGRISNKGFLGPTNRDRDAGYREDRISTLVPTNAIEMTLSSEAINLQVKNNGTVTKSLIVGGDIKKKDTQAKIGTFGDIEISDNLDLLKLPTLLAKSTQGNANDLLYDQDKGERRFTLGEMQKVFYKTRYFKTNQTVALRTLDQLDKPSVGHPIEILINSEAIIPVFPPGNPREHVGYFIALEPASGYPLNIAQYKNMYSDFSRMSGGGSGGASQLIKNVHNQTFGIDLEGAMNKDEQAVIYAEAIEANLAQRLNNGYHFGQPVSIARREDLMKIMMFRSLQQMQTRLLYVPASVMSYMAFDYHEDGTGKSMLDDLKILGSIRVTLMFSELMGNLKNAISKSKLKIQLDPNDPDPLKRVEFMVTEYARNTQSNFPIGMTSEPMQIVSFLQNAGTQVEVTGHEGYPVTNFEVEDNSKTVHLPDGDFSERIRKQFITGMELLPESVDGSTEVDFATSYVQRNLLFAKSCLTKQLIFVNVVSEHCKRFTINSAPLIDAMKKIIEDKLNTLPTTVTSKPNFKETLIAEYLCHFELVLPRPDTIKFEAQAKAYEQYKTSLDSAVVAWLDREHLSKTVLGELSESIETLAQAWKFKCLREWQIKNNFMPELHVLNSIGETGKIGGLEEIDGLETYIENIRKYTLDLMQRLVRNNATSDATINADGGVRVPESASSDGDGLDDDGLDSFDDDLDNPGGVDDEQAAEETPLGESEPKTDEQAEPDKPEDETGDAGTGTGAEGANAPTKQ